SFTLPPPLTPTLFPYTTLFRSQRIVLAAEHHADIGGVFLRGVEIGVAGDIKWQMQPDILLQQQCTAAQRLVVAQPRIVVTQESTDRKSTRLNSSHSQISYAVFC